MSGVATPAWFARHEARLVWRDFVSMMTAGKPSRARAVLLFAILIGAGLHALAWSLVGSSAGAAFPPDRATLVIVTGTAFLSWTLMLSQGLESVTRAFYARADLDLILSSPASSRLVFTLRMGAITLGLAGMSALVFGPIVNVLAVAGGMRWLAGYGVILAMAAAGSALALMLTVLMFRLIGARRTRLVSQIISAVVGAAFVIGIQAAAILSYGTLSRADGLRSDLVVSHAPALDSLAWLPARAAMGDGGALLAILVAAFALLAGAIVVATPRFAAYALDAAGLAQGSAATATRRRLRGRTALSALRRKEWVLLARDPWLVSQSLMQILYLIPPALLLWKTFGEGSADLALVAPVIVMAAGQLAGGLAWLAISGEDAPDLVATAPIPAGAVLRAKIEAVLAAIAVVSAPLLVALAFSSPGVALATGAGVGLAAASATAIQIAFRSQARRSHFRRRQTSSRAATFAEAFASILWAATAGLAAAGSLAALLPALLAAAIVVAVLRLGMAPAAALSSIRHLSGRAEPV